MLTTYPHIVPKFLPLQPLLTATATTENRICSLYDDDEEEKDPVTNLDDASSLFCMQFTEKLPNGTLRGWNQ